MKLKCKMTKTGKEWKEFMRKLDVLDDNTKYELIIKCRSVRDFDLLRTRSPREEGLF